MNGALLTSALKVRMSTSAPPRTDIVSRLSRMISTPGGFLGLLSALVLAHFIVRGLLYPAAPTDDAEQLLFSQVFRAGYDVVNPPLYTWLVIAAQQVVGVEAWSVSLIKFPAYWLIFYFLYVLGRPAIEDDHLAILAALSPLWLYYVAWDAVLSYSHTVLATALIVAALVVLQRIQNKGGVLSYALFGIVLGLGILSKYTFGLAALAMIIAGIIYRPYRPRLLNPKMLIALLIAGLILTPHIHWLLTQSDMVGTAVSGKFEMNGDGGFLMARLKGVTSAFSSGFGFISPLWLVLLVVFWRPVRDRLRVHEIIPPATKFLAIYLFTVIAILAIFVLALGVTKIRAHYMFVLIPFPVVFFAWIKPALKHPRQAQIYGATLVVMAVLLVGGMVGKYISEPLRCKRCQLLVPYKDIGQKLRDIGFTGGTIFAYYFPHDLAGNLRNAFPETRIVSTKYPAITRPLTDAPGQCLIIWMPAPGGVMDARGMLQLANRDLGAGLPLADFSEKPLTFTFDRTDGRTEKLHYMLFEQGVGTCR